MVLLWLACAVAGGILIYVGWVLILGTLTEYSPPRQQRLTVTGRTGMLTDTVTTFSVMTWNIGYGGLDSEMDFFYDGGKRVRPHRISFQQTWAGILNFLKERDRVDFILLQEVDSGSRRSYFTDEPAGAGSVLPAFCRTYAINHNCRFIPVPAADPMGKVISGMVTFSGFLPSSAVRYGLDNGVRWPKRLFYMNRCFIVSRFPAGQRKELVLLNIHNSAYDTGGQMRRHEMEIIGKVLKEEYASGNWVVAGGDWNANPPDFDPGAITTGDRVKKEEFFDLASYLPGWHFVHDPEAPTNRNVDRPYSKGSTPVTILDFFVVSPNVRALNVRTLPTGFSISDHQPVILEFSLSSSE